MDTKQKDSSRLSLGDNVMTAILKMADGNPGATVAMVQIVRAENDIDHDSALRPMGTLMHLDDLGIYGPNLWVLYKDICGAMAEKVVLLLRARQLGFLAASEIVMAATRPSPTIFDFAGLLTKVRAQLPGFWKGGAL